MRGEHGRGPRPSRAAEHAPVPFGQTGVGEGEATEAILFQAVDTALVEEHVRRGSSMQLQRSQT